MLEWRRVKLAMGDREHAIPARIADAPDGSSYVVWRGSYGWSIGHAATPDCLTSPSPAVYELQVASDAQLVAEAWAAGLGWVVRKHDYCSVKTRDSRSAVIWDPDDLLEISDAESVEMESVETGDTGGDDVGWVADAWSCRCGASEFDFDNIGEAQAAARAHWRRELRKALEATE